MPTRIEIDRPGEQPGDINVAAVIGSDPVALVAAVTADANGLAQEFRVWRQFSPVGVLPYRRSFNKKLYGCLSTGGRRLQYRRGVQENCRLIRLVRCVQAAAVFGYYVCRR